MKLPQMRTGLAISAFMHAALLAWGLFSFAARPLAAKPQDVVLTDVISATEFSQLTKGVKNAPTVETPKPAVEKVGDPKPAEEVSPVAEKPEVRTSSAQPPLPAPKPPEPKPTKKPPQKPDPIADALKREDARKASEAKPKAQPQKPIPPQPRFDPNQIAALLDKRDPSRQSITGEALAPAPPSLGTRNGADAKLSQSELAAMRAKLMELWNPPVGVQNPEQMIVKIRIQLTRDGKLNGPPVVLTSGRGTVFETARDNAIRALFMGQPYTMLSPSTYDIWKEIEITFDPRDMYRG